MALVTATSLARGRRAAFRTSLGISTGTVIWATLSGLGVAALLQASAEAFTLVRLAGAGLPLFPGCPGRSGTRSRRGGARTVTWCRDRAATVRPSVPPGSPDEPAQSKGGPLLHDARSRRSSTRATRSPSCPSGLVWRTRRSGWPGSPSSARRSIEPATSLRRPRIRRAVAGFTGAVLVFFGVRVVADPG